MCKTQPLRIFTTHISITRSTKASDTIICLSHYLSKSKTMTKQFKKEMLQQSKRKRLKTPEKISQNLSWLYIFFSRSGDGISERSVIGIALYCDEMVTLTWESI